MRLGAALPINAPDGGPLDGADIAGDATRIESLGFDSIWTFDAVGRGFIMPDPFMALAVAATVTRRVELGIGIVQLPLRPTADTAYRALTLHHLAGGRFVLGVGPGSTRSDFDAFETGYDTRFARFEAQLPVLRSLLTTGRHGTTDLRPWPSTAGGPELVLAGWRGRWVERAAREGDGWVASALHNDEDTLADAIGRYRAAGGSRAIATSVIVDPDPARTVDRLRRLEAMGFDDVVIVDLTPTDDRLGFVRECLPPLP